MSGLSVATCMERSVRFERRPLMFEVHTVKEDGGKEPLGAEEGRVGRDIDRVWEITEELRERAG